MVRITYVWHDCFVVETDAVAFVFDYWLDEHGENGEMPLAVERLLREKPLYVFVSHGHKDHYNPRIFGWAEEFPKIRYVVSNDVRRRIRHIVSATSVYSGPKVREDQVTALRPGESFDDGRVCVRAFPSTDIGDSYMVETSGMRFFHAGDLNAWIWKDESTEQEVKKALGDYKACLRDIAAYLDTCPDRRIDYCFFPVDSRIGRDYFTGAAMMVREFDVDFLFPMHFALGNEKERAKRREDALRFDLYANPQRGKYIALSAAGDLFLKTR